MYFRFLTTRRLPTTVPAVLAAMKTLTSGGRRDTSTTKRRTSSTTTGPREMPGRRTLLAPPHLQYYYTNSINDDLPSKKASLAFPNQSRDVDSHQDPFISLDFLLLSSFVKICGSQLFSELLPNPLTYLARMSYKFKRFCL